MEYLANDFTTRLVDALPASGGTTFTVSPGAPAAAVGQRVRARVGTEIVLCEVTTATSWAIVNRAAEDADRFPARAWPAGTAVDLVLTRDGFEALVAGQARTYTADQTLRNAKLIVEDDADPTNRIAIFHDGDRGIIKVGNSLTEFGNENLWIEAQSVTFKIGDSAAGFSSGGWVSLPFGSGIQWPFPSPCLDTPASGDGRLMRFRNGHVVILNKDAGDVAFTVTAAAGQTANLQEWKNFAGDTLAYVTATGHLRCSSVTTGSISAETGITCQGAITAQSLTVSQAVTGAAIIVGAAGLWTDGTSNASTPGTVIRKLPIYTASGSLIGYLPIYDAIT